MKIHSTIILLYIMATGIACKTGTMQQDVQPKDSIILAYEVISPRRDSVSKTPVAVYSEPVKGYDTKHGFYVAIYETPETFHYNIKMCYKFLEASDTLKIPNFGVWPNPQLIKGEKRPSCIAGFLDKEGKFKESKLIYDEDGNLRVHVLKHYAVATYRDSVKNEPGK